MIFRYDTVPAKYEFTPDSLVEAQPISAKLKENLLKLEINHLFPIQIELLSKLQFLKNYSRFRRSDLLVNASTGSGKTLAYAIPLVEALQSRVVTRIRCLIMIPTRDLALQVKDTFEELIHGTDLSLGLAIGSTSFQFEQNHLVTKDGDAKCDILIATPGRLIDHIEAGLCLNHLRFLVLDEADRLMTQHYHGWLSTLLAAMPKEVKAKLIGERSQQDHGPPVLKLLFSATISTDPRHLDSMDLYQPIMITLQQDIGSSQNIMNLPSTLQEGFIVMEPSEKPLFILERLSLPDTSHTLVFANSIEKAVRLSDLLNQCMKSELTLPMSSNQTPVERKKAIDRFKDGSIKMLIATDILCRGVDFGTNVALVINYDVPCNSVTYVHRVGRTARAGKQGQAWTVVEPTQAHWYKKEILNKDIARNQVQRRHFREEEFAILIPRYQNGLDIMKQKYRINYLEEVLESPDAIDPPMKEH